MNQRLYYIARKVLKARAEVSSFAAMKAMQEGTSYQERETLERFLTKVHNVKFI